MSKSYDEAILELQGYLQQDLSLDDLKSKLTQLIGELDVTSKNTNSGATTVLYSKYDVSGLTNDPNVRLLDKTDAAEFLDVKTNNTLQLALSKIFDQEYPFDRNTPVNLYLNGVPGYPRTWGAWDIISDKFVRAGSGELLILVGEGSGPGDDQLLTLPPPR